MNAEFQWWLLIVGAVIGGALVYLVLADMRSDDRDEPMDEPSPGSSVVGSSGPGDGVPADDRYHPATRRVDPGPGPASSSRGDRGTDPGN